MAKKKETITTEEETVVEDTKNGIEVDEKDVDTLIEQAEALAVMHERAVLRALMSSLEVKIADINKTMKRPQIQKNSILKSNIDGYLKAMTEVYYACNVLMNMTEDDVVKNNEQTNEEEENGEGVK